LKASRRFFNRAGGKRRAVIAAASPQTLMHDQPLPLCDSVENNRAEQWSVWLGREQFSARGRHGTCSPALYYRLVIGGGLIFAT